MALLLAVLVYGTVAVTLVAVLGADGVASSAAPIRSAVEAGRWAWAAPVVAVGGAVATLGALLALVAGVARTTLGAVGCAALVVTLPPVSVAAGTAVLAVGLGYRLVRRKPVAPGGRPS